MDKSPLSEKKDLTHSVILHIPHSSTHIPDSIQGQFLLDAEQLYQEQLKMVDRYTDELFVSKGYPRIVSKVSRLVCDMERFSDDTKEPMALVGMGMIYKKTHDGKQLRRKLDDQEQEYLLQTYHQRNERDVESAVREAISSSGRALIIDCHSFPSVPHQFEADQRFPRPDICIGTDSFHTPDDLLDLLQSYFTGKGYSVAINSPYSGTYVPLPLYQRTKNCLSIMIEVNRSLYMDEATGKKLPRFGRVQNQIVMLLEKMNDFALAT